MSLGGAFAAFDSMIRRFAERFVGKEKKNKEERIHSTGGCPPTTGEDKFSSATSRSHRCKISQEGANAQFSNKTRCETKSDHVICRPKNNQSRSESCRLNGNSNNSCRNNSFSERNNSMAQHPVNQYPVNQHPGNLLFTSQQSINRHQQTNQHQPNNKYAVNQQPPINRSMIDQHQLKPPLETLQNNWTFIMQSNGRNHFPDNVQRMQSLGGDSSFNSTGSYLNDPFRPKPSPNPVQSRNYGPQKNSNNDNNNALSRHHHNPIASSGSSASGRNDGSSVQYNLNRPASALAPSSGPGGPAVAPSAGPGLIDDVNKGIHVKSSSWSEYRRHDNQPEFSNTSLVKNRTFVRSNSADDQDRCPNVRRKSSFRPSLNTHDEEEHRYYLYGPTWNKLPNQRRLSDQVPFPSDQSRREIDTDVPRGGATGARRSTVSHFRTNVPGTLERSRIVSYSEINLNPENRGWPRFATNVSENRSKQNSNRGGCVQETFNGMPGVCGGVKYRSTLDIQTCNPECSDISNQSYSSMDNSDRTSRKGCWKQITTEGDISKHVSNVSLSVNDACKQHEDNRMLTNTITSAGVTSDRIVLQNNEQRTMNHELQNDHQLCNSLSGLTFQNPVNGNHVNITDSEFHGNVTDSEVHGNLTNCDVHHGNVTDGDVPKRSSRFVCRTMSKVFDRERSNLNVLHGRSKSVSHLPFKPFHLQKPNLPWHNEQSFDCVASEQNLLYATSDEPLLIRSRDTAGQDYRVGMNFELQNGNSASINNTNFRDIHGSDDKLTNYSAVNSPVILNQTFPDTFYSSFDVTSNFPVNLAERSMSCDLTTSRTRMHHPAERFDHFDARQEKHCFPEPQSHDLSNIQRISYTNQLNAEETEAKPRRKNKRFKNKGVSFDNSLQTRHSSDKSIVSNDVTDDVTTATTPDNVKSAFSNSDSDDDPSPPILPPRNYRNASDSGDTSCRRTAAGFEMLPSDVYAQQLREQSFKFSKCGAFEQGPSQNLRTNQTRSLEQGPSQNLKTNQTRSTTKHYKDVVHNRKQLTSDNQAGQRPVSSVSHGNLPDVCAIRRAGSTEDRGGVSTQDSSAFSDDHQSGIDGKSKPDRNKEIRSSDECNSGSKIPIGGYVINNKNLRRCFSEGDTLSTDPPSADSGNQSKPEERKDRPSNRGCREGESFKSLLLDILNGRSGNESSSNTVSVTRAGTNKTSEIQKSPSENETSDRCLTNMITTGNLLSKEELDSISTKPAFKNKVCLKESYNGYNQLENDVCGLVQSRSDDRQFDKFRSYIDQLDKVLQLAIKLSLRLSKVDADIQSHGASDVGKKKQLMEKRNQLMEQLQEAKVLKIDIDRRGRQVAGQLKTSFESHEYNLFEQLVHSRSLRAIHMYAMECPKIESNHGVACNATECPKIDSNHGVACNDTDGLNAGSAQQRIDADVEKIDCVNIDEQSNKCLDGTPMD